MIQATEGEAAIREQTVRVFFAVWPDDTAKKQLAVLTERLQAESHCGGRKTEPENIHLTLVFVGQVDLVKLEALYQAVNGMSGSAPRAFDIVIEEIRYWKHNRIAYAAIHGVPQELVDLVNALQDVLSASGFPIERRTYNPHITLIRKISCHSLPRLGEPIAWRAREWMLVKSKQTSDGSVYIPIGRWPLKEHSNKSSGSLKDSSA
ncbi:MAG: RNA 2',3'-cyclic phosphodiesterase [Nitrosospira sp.]